MGKKTRKTRWRTLPIADESDSEESNVLSSTQLAKNYHHRPYYSKLTYSSQSTPTRRFPYESKSTRSSSTASETKITFNEDEYTKITTPRQDVLFKKGYLSKPKNYQTQTSTGNSTASTGNSTGNGTPDHQSADGTEGTDLEYESQFVFPNAAFVDHNGIYYINGYEHYPLVMYNHPPICYPDYSVSRTKRHSTGSLTESTSPHTEETGQDLSQSGGENASNPPETNHVFNVVYPSYYFNTTPCSNNVTTNGQATSTEPRKIKKKRRRKLSKTVAPQEDGTSTVSSSEEEGYSSDEDVTQVENRVREDPIEDNQSRTEEENCQTKPDDGAKPIASTPDCPSEDKATTNTIDNDEDSTHNNVGEVSEEPKADGDHRSSAPEIAESSKFNLNAEEFVPRAYRPMDHVPLDPTLHFVNVHPNFVPLPLLNPSPSNFNPPFLPPGIPLNFVAADPKLLPNFVNFVPNQYVPPNKIYDHNQPPHNTPEHLKKEDVRNDDAKDDEVKENDHQERGDQADGGQKDVSEEGERLKEKPRKELTSAVVYKTEVDIAKIVSKLEEAAKEQKYFEDRRQNYRSPSKFNKSPKMQRYNNQSYDKRKSRRFQEAPKKIEEVTVQQKAESVQTKTEEIQTDPPQIKTEIPASTDEHKVLTSPKHQSYRGSPKKYPNYNNRNIKSSKSIETHNHQLSRSVPNNAEYSESLKRPPTSYNSKSCPRFERYNSNNNARMNTQYVANRANSVRKIEDAIKDTSSKIPDASKSSQWISVSNKKKRNKNNRSGNEEEIDVVPDTEESILDVPAPIEAEVKAEISEEGSSVNVENFIEIVSSSKEVLPEADIPKIEMQDLKDVEKELLKDVTPKAVEEIPENIEAKVHIELPVQPVKIQKDSQRKKNKKSSNKSGTKRIIILDPDLTSQKQQSASISDKENPNTEAKNTKAKEDPAPNEMKNSEEQTPEKKKSKKKKKLNKTNLMSTSITSISSSSTTLNNADDSYDFLLDTSALIDDKTNVEISEELDKMIQKGLFGNLEEKFKSLNVSVDDDFFRSLSLKPKTQSTPEKGFIKATNFTTILNGANQNLPKMKAVEENDKIDVDFSKIKLPECEPQPSTSRTGHFLDEVIQSETGPPLDSAGEDVGSSKSNDGRLKNKSKKCVVEVEEEEKIVAEDEEACCGVEANLENDDGLNQEEDVEGKLPVIQAAIEDETLTEVNDNNFLKNDDHLTINIEATSSELTASNISITMSELTSNFEESHQDDTTSKDSIELKPLYPITEAVKEWMSKTRETTPDVELLKSPDTIYKEFLIEDSTEDEAESDTETEQKNVKSNPSPADYPRKEGGRRVATKRIEEDQITISETWSMSEDGGLQEEDLLDCWEAEPIEQGEDALESYESHYGKDEDFIKLKSEIEQHKRNGTLPKHGSLPYRAICCNLM